MFGVGPLEFMIVVMVALLLLGSAVFVGAIVYAMGRNAVSEEDEQAEGGPSSSSESEDSALRIARERYARGEINHEEFEQIKATLGY